MNFTGTAKINKDWSAGYVLHLEAIDSDVYTTNQNTPVGPAALTGAKNSVQVLYSYWFLKSEELGKLSVGKVSPADDNAIVSLDSSGTLAGGLLGRLRRVWLQCSRQLCPGQSMIWGNASSCRGYGGGPGDCDGLPRNAIRYDTPAYKGFSAIASWGEDDDWALAGWYANTPRRISRLRVL